MFSGFRTINVLLLAILPVLTIAQAEGSAMDAKALQQLYLEFLSKEGFRPEVDKDGDVQFKVEGSTYFIDVSEDDPEFFRLVLPNIWEIENAKERSQCLLAVDHSNAEVKVAKSYLVKDNIWVGVELFLPDQQDFSKVFARSLAAIDSGVAAFVAKMKENKK